MVGVGCVRVCPSALTCDTLGEFAWSPWQLPTQSYLPQLQKSELSQVLGDGDAIGSKGGTSDNSHTPTVV